MKKQKIDMTQEDINKLLSTVEENATMDRSKAIALFTSLESMIEDPDQHMMFGQQASSYLNAATRSNDQLMKVAITKHKIFMSAMEANDGSAIDKKQIEKMLEDYTPGVLNYNNDGRR